MSAVNFKIAEQELQNIIDLYEGRKHPQTREIQKLTRGKLYEFFVLGEVLKELRHRGYRISLQGTVLTLKQGPGKIKLSDTHFIAHSPRTEAKFRICTDIEVKTLGSTLNPSSGLCSYHEIDIVVVDYNATGRPSYDQLALGVECKSTDKFTKSLLKEALGIKREISLLASEETSVLAREVGASTPKVPSRPPLEYWVAFCDPNGLQYQQSPRTFGIVFKHWQP